MLTQFNASKDNKKTDDTASSRRHSRPSCAITIPARYMDDRVGVKQGFQSPAQPSSPVDYHTLSDALVKAMLCDADDELSEAEIVVREETQSEKSFNDNKKQVAKVMPSQASGRSVINKPAGK